MTIYLASFCNAGRACLALLNKDGLQSVINLSDFCSPLRPNGATGLCISEDSLYISLQSFPACVLRLDKNFKLQGRAELSSLRDLHGLAAGSGRLAIVSTGTNQIAELPLDLSGSPVLKWGVGETLCDVDHINDVSFSNGRLLAAMFGPRLPNAMRSGRIVDVNDGSTVISGLREPHSVYQWAGRTYVLESASGDLIEHTDGFNPSRLFGVIGYVRGLYVDEDGFVLGKSGYRNISRSVLGDTRQSPHIALPDETNPLGRSTIYFLSHNGEAPIMVDTSSIGHEIYQIIRLPNHFGRPTQPL